MVRIVEPAPATTPDKADAPDNPMDYTAWLDEARQFFRGGATREVPYRRAQLAALAAGLRRHEAALLAALAADLGKPAAEAYASEIGFVLADIAHARHRVRRWCRPQRRPVPLFTWPAKGWVRPEPRGVVLVVGPWNYPVQLLLSPLVAALAAGNCVALKPSPAAPATAAAVAALIRDTFPPTAVAVFAGDDAAARTLVALPFDHIFFTGSPRIGRHVMAAAAANLTPVTLELGGRNPCLVLADADLRVAARRIAWGKFLNAGQTCVAPNHVYVARRVHGRLVEELCAAVREFYGADPRTSPDYGRLVSARHYERLLAMLDGGRIACGGAHCAAERYLAPTVMVDPDPDGPVMREEIFGPILPVLAFDDLDRLLAALSREPAPLALYLFTTAAPATRARILSRVPSGGACINDTVNHIVGRSLPFGGIGESGMGAYHGRAGFDCFTHYRSILVRAAHCDPGLVYPPAKLPLRWLKRFYGWLAGR